jgi:hypothetical protein
MGSIYAYMFLFEPEPRGSSRKKCVFGSKELIISPVTSNEIELFRGTKYNLNIKLIA